jgi:hypothetical protein
MAKFGAAWNGWSTDLNGAALNNAASNQQSFSLTPNEEGTAQHPDVIEIQVDITAGTSTDIDVNFYGGDLSSQADTTSMPGSYNVTGNDIRTVRFYGTSEVKCVITDNDATDDGSVTAKHNYREWTDAAT